MYEIKYYSVSAEGKKFLHTSTRPFIIRDGESVQKALVRLKFIIEMDMKDAISMGRCVIFVTVRYCSESSPVTFSEVLYTDSFTF